MPISQQRLTRDLVVAAFGEMLDEQEYDHHLGIPLAVTCVSGLIAQARGDSVLWMRPADKGKQYGTHELIQGHYAPGERVVLNDNVITDGASKLEVADHVTAAGLEIVRFNVLVDREEGGRETIEDAGHCFSAHVGMQQVCDILLENGRITPEQHGWAVEYRSRVAASQQN